MLGDDQPVILQMLDITPAMEALNGVRMELEDCAFPLLAGIVCTDDPNTAFKHADYETVTDMNALERWVAAAIDLGAVAAEFFALGLDPYPRKPGEAFDDMLALSKTPIILSPSITLSFGQVE